jgi:hypothetical protein
MRNAHTILVVKSDGMNGRITLKRKLRKQGGRVWTGFIWLKIGTDGGLL